MAEPVCVVTFTVDEPYLQEFYTELTSQLPGWRTQRIASLASGFLGLVLASAFVSANVAVAGLPAVVLVGVALGLHVRARRHREAWMGFARGLPSFGHRVCYEIRDGELQPTSDTPTLPGYRRTSELSRTPRGYLLRLERDDDLPGAGPAVSQRRASVYLPHSGIRPGMTADAFLALLR